MLHNVYSMLNLWRRDVLSTRKTDDEDVVRCQGGLESKLIDESICWWIGVAD